MKVFSQYGGAMADWPEVSEVEGVGRALADLQARCSMVVATNAVNSDAGQIKKALQRVGLDTYFQTIYTSQALHGARKPELRFFRQIEQSLGRPGSSILMIGDDYAVDVLGAKAAGWRAIWYNPLHKAATGLTPLQDAEFYAMDQLAAAVARPPLPDYATCMAWLVGRGTPYNILAHVQLVAAVAYQLAVWLSAAGVPVDPVLAHRGGMLHDLAKIDSLPKAGNRSVSGNRPDMDHARMAHDLLLQLEQPELAEIAGRHMPYTRRDDPRRPQTWEQRIVHYADKLSEGTQFVPIEERLQALKQRYPGASDDLEKSWPFLQALQAQICGQLQLSVPELYARLRKELGIFKKVQGPGGSTSE